MTLAIEALEAMLASGQAGVAEDTLRAAVEHARGADAAIATSVRQLRGDVWGFPVESWLPRAGALTSPQGAFGARRGSFIHTGVDLYVRGQARVLAVEDGRVVAIERFTGPEMHPRWLETQAVLVEGASGVVVYGEVTPACEVGQRVERGACIARVSPVLAKGAERWDIPGHSRFMLHLELHRAGTRATCDWCADQARPRTLLDPTGHLQSSEVLTNAR